MPYTVQQKTATSVAVFCCTQENPGVHLSHMELKDITKEAVIISENGTFAEALDMMLNNHTNTLLVSGEDGILVGEVSVSDLFEGMIPITEDGDAAMAHFADEMHFKEALHNAKETPVFEFMSSDFHAITPDDDLVAVAAIAVGHGRARMPIVDHENRPIGMVSRQGLKQILGKYMHQR
tara:strand:+ start:279 stop:815 length:537 start_codon:yes stop_codon:yes gene_type:complete